MKLRKLAHKDIPLMLEWMRDPDINRFFQFNAGAATEDTVKAFVEQSFSEAARHYACADEADEYLGTVSLKGIDAKHRHAEYATSFRKSAMGSGAAAFATQEILRIAFDELGLERVFLNVMSSNPRAIRFYEKMGFIREGEFLNHLCINGSFQSLCWYRMLRSEFDERR